MTTITIFYLTLRKNKYMTYIIEYRDEVDDNIFTKEVEIEANDRVEAIKKFLDTNSNYRDIIEIRELC